MRAAQSARKIGAAGMLHFGDTLDRVVIRRKRIVVTRDPELESALERARRFFPDRPAAAVVHDLAIKGAVALEEEEAKRKKAAERVLEKVRTRTGLDWDALERHEEIWPD